MHRHILFLLLLALGTACASTASSPARHADRDRLLQEEIAAAHEPNLYNLVQKLRPQWLRKRGAKDLRDQGEIVVYYGRTRLGGPESLRRISTSEVASLRFLSGPEANTRFGRGHEHGAIIVTSW